MTLFARHALLADGWASDVRFDVEDGRIRRLVAGASRRNDDDRADVVIPGLCNAHSHAFQRALCGRTERRSPAATDTFWSWRHLMYAMAARVGPEELRCIARQLYIEMVASGYTSVVEFHYLHRAKNAALTSADMLAALLEAARESGIRLTFVPVLYERADFDQPRVSSDQAPFHLSLDSYLNYVDGLQGRPDGPERIGIAAHSLRTVTGESLTRLVALATERDVPLHLHIAEQDREVRHCIEHCGARPLRWLFDRYDVNDRWTLVHATHADDDERQRLAASGAVTCLCPSTEANLGDGLFPLQAYLQEGGAISIGSDSHVTINPFEELRWLEYGQRLAMRERNVTATGRESSGERLFNAALSGGAKSAYVANRNEPAAGLQEGGLADLLVLDGQSSALLGHGVDSLLDALVFAGQPLPIERVMVSGKWVVRQGVHAGAAAAAAAYAATLRRLLPASGAAS